MAIGSHENHLLAAVAAIAGERLMSRVERVKLKLGQVLHEPDDVMQNVYFPIDVIVSLLHVMETGNFAETAVIGNDGVVGVALIMGGESMPLRAQAQSEGYAYRLRSALLRRELADSPPLQQVFLRYAQALLTQMGQVAACNRHHALDQQFCRRLLMSLDRLPASDIRMTQEAIANALGVRRESVTLAAYKLHKAGVIRYSRGHIHVLDRPRLESLACECYGTVRKEIRRLRLQPATTTRFVDGSVGLRTEAAARSGEAADILSIEGIMNVSRNVNDRRRGNDRRGPANRRHKLVVIGFPNRRADDRRSPGGR